MLYPKLNSSRTLIDLSGIWDFKADDGTGFDNKWYAKKLENPLTMAVPASCDDQKVSAELRDHYGWVFYQSELTIPKTLKDQRIVLRFGAVTHYAEVYLNGELIFEHKGDFLPFEVEIHDKVKFDTNLLTVAVDNKIDHSTLPVGSETGETMMGSPAPNIPGLTPKKKNHPNFDFFNYAGIIRPVKLYSTPVDYIRDITIVPKVEGNDAIVSYEIDTVGQGEISLEVYSECGKLVAQAKGHSSTFKIENVRLWQPLNAYIYTVKIRFGEDSYEQTFGVRTVEVKGISF